MPKGAPAIRLVAAVLAGGVVAVAAQTADELERMPAAKAIPAITQQLVNALPGDPSVWQRFLSADVVFVGEAGDVANKAELLEGFAPFPPGLTGSIEVKNPRVKELGDVAISVVDLHEKQQVYDQHIEVDYRATHTWRRENGAWRLVAAQAVVLAKDPLPLPVDSRKLRDYVGAYELSGKRRYIVEQHGDTLVGGREKSPLAPLVPIGDNAFFEAGSNLGILRIFVRGRDGAVDRLIVRRKYADTVWLRVPNRK